MGLFVVSKPVILTVGILHTFEVYAPADKHISEIICFLWTVAIVDDFDSVLLQA